MIIIELNILTDFLRVSGILATAVGAALIAVARNLDDAAMEANFKQILNGGILLLVLYAVLCMPEFVEWLEGCIPSTLN